jgi:hypothetical protein
MPTADGLSVTLNGGPIFGTGDPAATATTGAGSSTDGSGQAGTTTESGSGSSLIPDLGGLVVDVPAVEGSNSGLPDSQTLLDGGLVPSSESLNAVKGDGLNIGSGNGVSAGNGSATPTTTATGTNVLSGNAVAANPNNVVPTSSGSAGVTGSLNGLL